MDLAFVLQEMISLNISKESSYLTSTFVVKNQLKTAIKLPKKLSGMPVFTLTFKRRRSLTMRVNK